MEPRRPDRRIRVATGLLVAGLCAMLQAGGSDFGGDGRSDILWRHTSGALYLWQMNGTSVTAASSIPPISTAWQVAGVDDFGGDGRGDILWRESASGATYLWTMQGATLTAGAYTDAQTDNTWSIQGLGDFGGDGRSDILWRHTGGALYVWQMNGTTLTAASYLPPIALEWSIKGLGDFDGDGRADILWREAASGATYLWFMDGATTVAAGYTESQTDNTWTVQGVGDFDADGKSDILWRHTGGALYVWQMDGTATNAASYLPPISLAWQIKQLEDFDGDGKADILWRENSSGSTYVWLMDGAAAVGAGYTTSQADNTWVIQPPTPSTTPGVITIDIVGMSGSNSYSPNPRNLQVGQQVRWRNTDFLAHTATQDGGGFDTGSIAPGATSAPITMSTPGAIGYHCTIHPSMVGTLNVTP